MSFDTFDPDTWHPVRLPGVSEPPGGREIPKMTAWCETNCAHAWLQVQNKSGQTVFWFETDTDAMQFSWHWFPPRYL